MSRATPAIGLILALLCLGPASATEIIEDHEYLEGPFETGPDVTAACLDCHDEAAHDFMQTSHWRWSSLQNMRAEGEVWYGKKNALNNYCIALPGNWPRCTSCHAGYGWENADFDFEEPENVDCLVCHDRTGEYRKFPTGAGHPTYVPQEWQGKLWEPVDLAMVARSVGTPSRANCGACHFFGGGGNAVKHGDLDTSLLEPALALDVHMSADGADMLCQDCHGTENHAISGHAMVASPSGSHRLECTECHDEDAHEKRVLNWHTRSVACQTCHIPSFARERPTLVRWDWSDAGKDLPATTDAYGQPTFAKKKGTLRWEKDIVPTYAWYNGTAGTHQLGDTMNPDGVTRLNWPHGSRQDVRARIYPFKIHRGKQPYDVRQGVFISPKLYGDGGYWETFDWDAAARAGMAAAGLEYSGEHAFAETVMYWKINHMVAPAADALRCIDCHDKEGGGRIDWGGLGYSSDPLRERGVSRFELKEAYAD